MKNTIKYFIWLLVFLGASCNLLQEPNLKKELLPPEEANWIIKGEASAVVSTCEELGLTLCENLAVEGQSYFLVKIPHNFAFTQDSFLEKLRGKGDVDWIERDQKTALADAIQPFSSFPVYYQNIQAWSDVSRLAEALSLYGVGSSIAQMAFVDTGFDTDHLEFSDESVFKGFSIVSRDANNTTSLITTNVTHMIDGVSYEVPQYVAMTKGIEWDSNPGEGHGSHVAGIMAGKEKILGACPANRYVLGYKLFSNDKYGKEITDSASLFGIFSALVHIHLNRKNNNVVVVNYSLGFESPSRFAIEMIQFAYRHNILIMASSGNDGYIASSFPAHYSGVMPIGATNGRGDLAYFSSGSPTLSVVALGENVYSVKSGPDNEYRYMSGTSMSCPFVVGVAGYLLTFAPTLSAGELRTVIEDTAKRKDSLKWDNRYGYGVVDVKAALERVKRHQAFLEGNPQSVPEDQIQSRYSGQQVEILVSGSLLSQVEGLFFFLNKKGGITGEEEGYRYYTLSFLDERKKIVFSGLPFGEYKIKFFELEVNFTLTPTGTVPASLNLVVGS